MNLKVALERDGTITIITTDGTFEQGAPALQDLLDKLAAQGLRVSNVCPPEQHRHDDGQTHTHVHDQEARHVS